MTVSGAAIRTEALTGWGRTMSTVATVVPAIHENEMANYIREASSRGVLARGLGRSYGDAAQSGGATVFDMTTYNNFSLDQATMTLTAQAGASIDDMRAETAVAMVIFPVNICSYCTTNSNDASSSGDGNKESEWNNLAQNVVDACARLRGERHGRLIE